VQPVPLAAVVDLVNGWGTVPRERAGEQDQAFPPRQNVIKSAGRSAGAVRDADLRRCADLLYPVFATTDSAERAGALADLLARTGIRPTARADGSGIEAGWIVGSNRHVVLASAAIALHAQLTGQEPDRLGTCSAVRCADVFVDASPAGHRRFCSITCQNRTRVAAFRRRKSESG
jgi:predicted RNA-binding Zn ribbon-like protein